MAVTTVQTNNKGIKFRNSIIREYVRGNMFSPYMGEDGTAVFRSFYEEGKYGGDQINVPLVKALRNGAIGVGTLTGNEEKIDNYGCRFWLDWARNAVTANKAEIKKGSFDIFAQAQPLLSDWGKTLQRDEMVLAMLSIPSETAPAGLGSDAGQRINGVLWSAASAGQKNAWMVANADRVQFGVLNSNASSGVFATAAALVDASADKMSAAIIRLLKSKAEKATPKIEPITTDDGYERYVLFVGSNAFRDLEADADIKAANKDARPREGSTYRKNPIFMDGDLLYHGVIIRKVPEIDKYLTLAGVGADSINVAPVFLCGRSAVGLLWGQMPEPTKLDDTDYQFKRGIGVEMAYGVGKVFYKDTTTGNLVDWGIVTGFIASVDDA